MQLLQYFYYADVPPRMKCSMNRSKQKPKTKNEYLDTGSVISHHAKRRLTDAVLCTSGQELYEFTTEFSFADVWIEVWCYLQRWNKNKLFHKLGTCD